jgi:hypothetical protein
MPVQLVEQLDETDVAGNTTQFMQATFTVGQQSSPLIVRVPFDNNWVANLTAAIEAEAQGVRTILDLNP